MRSLITIFVAIIMIMATFYLKIDSEEVVQKPVDLKITVNSPPCIQMFNSIEKYSNKYDIPRDYAYGIAYAETHYQGPFHWEYKHTQTSSAGALGPMQLMYATAKGLFPKKEFSREELMEDIDFNVECSMKLLRQLHNKYKDWKIVFGAYNTGRAMINDYAMNVYNYQLNSERTIK